MMLPSAGTRVYMATGRTDMRKAINGLSMLVQGALELDPFSGHLFAFCNRRRNLVKLLYWDRNGFCLWMKRIERQKFRWPETAAAVMELDLRQLRLEACGGMSTGFKQDYVTSHRRDLPLLDLTKS